MSAHIGICSPTVKGTGSKTDKPRGIHKSHTVNHSFADYWHSLRHTLPAAWGAPIYQPSGCRCLQLSRDRQMRLSTCEIAGDILVIHVTDERGICGALFYPATDTDLLKLRSAVAALEVAGGD